MGVGALPLDELLGLEQVDEGCDGGSLLDHALRDLERGQSIAAGTAKDAEDVVLLDGDAVGFDGRADEAAEDVGGAHERDGGLLTFGGEGLALLDFIENRHARGATIPANS